MVQHLLANGCSNSCAIDPDEPGQIEVRPDDVYPGVLRKLLDIPQYTNIALGGSSNDRIVRTTLEWIANYMKTGGLPEDLFVLIGWTQYYRKEFTWEHRDEIREDTWRETFYPFFRFWPGMMETQEDAFLVGTAREYWRLRTAFGTNDHVEQLHRFEEREGTYPGLIAEALGCNLIQSAKQHASNDYIMRKTLEWVEQWKDNEDAQQNTLFLISWTDPRRREFYWDKPMETKRLTWPVMNPTFVQYVPHEIEKIRGQCNRFWDLHGRLATNEHFEHSRWGTQAVLLQNVLRRYGYKFLFVNTHVPMIAELVGEQELFIDLRTYHEPYSYEETFLGYIGARGFKPGATGNVEMKAHQGWADLLLEVLAKL